LYDAVQRAAGMERLRRRLSPILGRLGSGTLLDVGAGTGSLYELLPPHALRDAKRLARELDGSQLAPGAGEVARVRPDPATDLEHPLAVPALELGEGRNVRLDQVLPSFDLVELRLRPDRLGEWRMLQGHASQYRSTSAMVLSVEL
jgi:hypothetical protein